MVYFIRNSFQKFENIFLIVKGYFSDLNIDFIYELFRKMHLFMMQSFNFTSTEFLSTINDLEDKIRTLDVGKAKGPEQM